MRQWTLTRLVIVVECEGLTKIPLIGAGEPARNNHKDNHEKDENKYTHIRSSKHVSLSCHQCLNSKPSPTTSATATPSAATSATATPSVPPLSINLWTYPSTGQGAFLWHGVNPSNQNHHQPHFHFPYSFPSFSKSVSLVFFSNISLLFQLHPKTTITTCTTARSLFPNLSPCYSTSRCISLTCHLSLSYPISTPPSPHSSPFLLNLSQCSSRRVSRQPSAVKSGIQLRAWNFLWRFASPTSFPLSKVPLCSQVFRSQKLPLCSPYFLSQELQMCSQESPLSVSLLSKFSFSRQVPFALHVLVFLYWDDILSCTLSWVKWWVLLLSCQVLITSCLFCPLNF